MEVHQPYSQGVSSLHNPSLYREVLVGFAPLLYYINLQSFFLFLFEVQQAMHREMLMTAFPSQERRSLDNDVHIVGFSSLAAGHKTLLPQLVEELNKRGRGDILVAIGGVIPAQDYEFLREHGAVAIFGPGTVLPVAAKKLLETLTSHVQDEGND